MRFKNLIKISSITNRYLPEKNIFCVKANIARLYMEDEFYNLSFPLVFDDKKCKKKVVKIVSDDFHYPKCCANFLECDYNYVLKMDLEDDTGELLKVTAFEGLEKKI